MAKARVWSHEISWLLRSINMLRPI